MAKEKMVLLQTFIYPEQMNAIKALAEELRTTKAQLVRLGIDMIVENTEKVLMEMIVSSKLRMKSGE